MSWDVSALNQILTDINYMEDISVFSGKLLDILGYNLNTLFLELVFVVFCFFLLLNNYKSVLHYHHLLFIHPFFYSLVFKNVVKCHAVTYLDGFFRFQMERQELNTLVILYIFCRFNSSKHQII